MTDTPHSAARSGLSSYIDSTVVLIFVGLGLIRLVSTDNMAFIYALSFTYHAINLHAFLLRRGDPAKVMRHSLLFRTLAVLMLGYLLLPYIGADMNPWAIPIILVGFVLHTSAVWALGLPRTYYAVEFGALPAAETKRFPYSYFRHPMAMGASLEFIGLLLLFPAFNEAYPFLLLGHVALTLLTAVVEHYDLHFRNYFFTASVGTIANEEVRTTIDQLRNWSIEHFRSDLNQECSMHRYVKTFPEETIAQIDRLRYADELLDPIRRAFPNSKIVPMPMTDEFYISRYNYDRGGDQGLFDKHHDGNLRFMPATSVVRSLLYLSSDDKLEVVFDTSGIEQNFKTYEFGLLDFHKELHWVNGCYEPGNPPRVLLKCNYYVDHSGIAPYRWLGISLNVLVFYVVKAAMEYSKSPKTMFQKAIGWLCNVFRRLNNLSPAAPVALVVGVVALSVKAILLQLGFPF